MPVLVSLRVELAREAELAVGVQVDVLEDDDAVLVEEFLNAARRDGSARQTRDSWQILSRLAAEEGSRTRDRVTSRRKLLIRQIVDVLDA